MAKETYSYWLTWAPTPPLPPHLTSHLGMRKRQKRPIYMAKETYYMAKETYPPHLTSHLGMRKRQKRPIYMAKETYIYGKRDLLYGKRDLPSPLDLPP